VTTRETGSALWPWVIRVLLALAVLAAPIITFKAFTDSDAPDPVRQERLRKASEGNRGDDSPRRATTDPDREARP